MVRHILRDTRSQQQNTFIRTYLYRHPLVARIARQQQLLQLLMPTAQQEAQGPIWGRPLYRSPLIEQVPDAYTQPDAYSSWPDDGRAEQTVEIQSDLEHPVQTQIQQDNATSVPQETGLRQNLVHTTIASDSPQEMPAPASSVFFDAQLNQNYQIPQPDEAAQAETSVHLSDHHSRAIDDAYRSEKPVLRQEEIHTQEGQVSDLQRRQEDEVGITTEKFAALAVPAASSVDQSARVIEIDQLQRTSETDSSPGQTRKIEQAPHNIKVRPGSKIQRPRARIEEQPTQAVQPLPVSPVSHQKSGSDLHTPSETTSQVGRINADNLFLSQNTDRSVGTWLARLGNPISSSSEDRLFPPQSTNRHLEDSGNTENASASSVTELDIQRTIDILRNEANSYTTQIAADNNEETFQSFLTGEMFAPSPEDLSPSQKILKSSRFIEPYGYTKNKYQLQTQPANSEPHISSEVLQAEGPQKNAVETVDTLKINTNTRPAPTPLSQQTRNFLRPLVGIDPASVPVYRDAQAEQLTSPYQADAATIGHEIALSPGHPDDTPETLGLLAHELTHIVRQQQPRFIPPIMQDTPAKAMSTTQIQNADEETLALSVERHVRQAATQTKQQTIQPGEQIVAPSTTIGAHPPSNNPWNGLPAPWEPLPDWLVTPVQTGGTPTMNNTYQSPPIVQSGPTSNDFAAIGNSSSWVNTAAETAGSVQRAGIERSQGSETSIQQQDSGPEIANAPEPDLDALARQVYNRIKRRLGVESRRES